MMREDSAMCGRYTLLTELGGIADRFGVPVPGEEWATGSEKHGNE
jgi:hypothetical protein